MRNSKDQRRKVQLQPDDIRSLHHGHGVQPFPLCSLMKFISVSLRSFITSYMQSRQRKIEDKTLDEASKIKAIEQQDVERPEVDLFLCLFSRHSRLFALFQIHSLISPESICDKKKQKIK
ncbi:hypothetical protein SAY87_008471 [Trapa incisa]|uniref:Uncharacterized protein n=1 Tax=Trapa incisa TaxID=236973 RepID=A0AAN7KKP7_9MYRT|nr:hypothetical protein SAY87_008471 [Trapa incisa]